MPEYDTTELSNDPADYLNGPTGNTVNRTSGGTTKDGKVQRVVEDDSVRTQSSTPVGGTPEETSDAPAPAAGETRA